MEIISILRNINNIRTINKLLLYIRTPMSAIVGWIFGYPLTLILKRDPNLTVVINRPSGIFADNSKYFFAYATESAKKGERVIFLTTDRSIRDMINSSGGESVLYHSLMSIYLLLRSKRIVVDTFLIPFIFPLIQGAKLIQIWHGAPLKHIELDMDRKTLKDKPAWWRKLIRFYKRFIGRYPVYDVVVSTSQGLINSAFHSSFDARRFIVTGYPRNDILFGWPTFGSIAYKLALISVDRKVMEVVNSAKCNGKRICLYAPTFRKKLNNPFTSYIDLARISEFAVRHDILFILKLHPNRHGLYRVNGYPGVLEYHPLCDVYPLMRLCDLLITDYSSIYFDFLFFDRPILFYSYDLNNYLEHDRAMYFDYDAMTPGAKCRDQNELESKMDIIITNGCNDEYAEMRKQVRSFAHDYIDNQSHRRLLESI